LIQIFGKYLNQIYSDLLVVGGCRFGCRWLSFLVVVVVGGCRFGCRGCRWLSFWLSVVVVWLSFWLSGCRFLIFLKLTFLESGWKSVPFYGFFILPIEKHKSRKKAHF